MLLRMFKAEGLGIINSTHQKIAVRANIQKAKLCQEVFAGVGVAFYPRIELAMSVIAIKILQVHEHHTRVAVVVRVDIEQPLIPEV